MNRIPAFCLIGFFFVVISLSTPIFAETSDENIASRTANVEGMQLHYLTAGHGTAVILLRGFAETSRMWRLLISMLAEKFTVIAPDLPGIGDSSIPESGLDIKTSATRIHALVRSLGIEKARVVGHDTWHFRFNGEYPEALVKGRERTYFEYFWNVFTADKNHSIPEADRKAYTEAYSKPGRMRAAWAYFASWPELAKDFARLSQTKLILPVLSIGGEKSLGIELADQMKLVAADGTVVVLKNAGPLGSGGATERDNRRAGKLSLRDDV